MNKNSIEIERKYIIEMPDVLYLRGLEGYSESEITQTYLKSEKEKTRRVRRRARGGAVEYTENEKTRINEMSAMEREREISENEYFALIKEQAEGTSPITKRRYTFIQGGQLFEIDIYPEWKRSAIMETELDSCERVVKIPDFIHILREVTGIRAYSNAAMAREFPKEDI